MLDELYAGALADASRRSELISVAQLEEQIQSVREPRPISDLKTRSRVGIIAEIKRASPSKGPLADIPNASKLAKEYEQAGASMISVLTEERKFRGNLDDLNEVSATVACPVLRKDFIANRYQVLEARANGADVVLLIVAGLDQAKLEELFNFAGELGMSCLVETHSQDEFLRAVDIGAKFIGINARDLTTFETDRELFGKLAKLAPKEATLVAESAVRDVSDVIAYAASGADAVLVGEALVKGDHNALLSEFSQIPKIRI